MARACFGVFRAWPSPGSWQTRWIAFGTARTTGEKTGTRAASGWLSARVPADFSDAAGGYHLPVFPAESLAWLEAGPGRRLIDGTLGGGGHSELMLETGATVLGVDRDPEALAHAAERLARFGARFSPWAANFADLAANPWLAQGIRADGLLLDLGVSSRQLDHPPRGFSFQREGPLDMRMNPQDPTTAADLVNTWDEADLVRILFEFGEEPRARRIAAAIVRRRAERPFASTLDLASCIERAVGRRGRIHPATRSFQALRMAVNRELESLSQALEAAPAVLKPGGRLVIITFHSLEDRLVKQHLRLHSAPFIDDPGWPAPRPNPRRRYELLQRKAILPGPAEVSLNPRARSAKLRVARLLDNQP